jgi:hypothetical protein
MASIYLEKVLSEFNRLENLEEARSIYKRFDTLIPIEYVNQVAEMLLIKINNSNDIFKTIKYQTSHDPNLYFLVIYMNRGR